MKFYILEILFYGLDLNNVYKNQSFISAILIRIIHKLVNQVQFLVARLEIDSKFGDLITRAHAMYSSQRTGFKQSLEVALSYRNSIRTLQWF